MVPTGRAAPLVLPPEPLRRDDLGLALRPWGSGPGDAAALAAAWADPEVARWTAVPDRRDEPAAQHWIAGEGTRRATGRAVDLVVTGTESPGQVHGEVGLVVVDVERRWVEVGYWLFPAWRGRGRAAAALELFSGWVLRDLPVDRLLARTAPGNPASAGTARRAGYARAGALADTTEVWFLDRPPA